jgi:MoaA/NifB/PqqE/SkfB family radical SAM enzyme
MTNDADQAKIVLGFSCNNDCQFCYEKSNRHLPDKSTSEVKQEILAAQKKGRTKIHFIGGEPTIRTDIFDLINYTKKLGFKRAHITTNGRMFAYSKFANQMVASGILEVVFSIHGHSGKVHDSQTNIPGSFDQLVRGIGNLKKIKFDRIGTNTVVTKNNYRHLPKIGNILVRWKIRRAEFIYVAVMDQKNFLKYTPLVSKAAPYISHVLGMGHERGYRWDLLNPPMGCYFKNYFSSNISYGDSKKEELFVTLANAQAIHIASKKKVINYIRSKKCKDCSLGNECPGIWKKYRDHYGEKELKPIL